MLKIEIYQDASGGWRWRGVDGNYKIICDGSEGYVTRAGVETALENVMTEFRGDVQVVARNKRRMADRRGTSGWATFDEIATYEAEGAKK